MEFVRVLIALSEFWSFTTFDVLTVGVPTPSSCICRIKPENNFFKYYKRTWMWRWSVSVQCVARGRVGRAPWRGKAVMRWPTCACRITGIRIGRIRVRVARVLRTWRGYGRWLGQGGSLGLLFCLGLDLGKNRAWIRAPSVEMTFEGQKIFSVMLF